jgi:hypothetical protein
MPAYRIEALERFTVRTTYYVTAASEAQAEQLCSNGQVPYDGVSIEEDPGEWLTTLSVELLEEG